MKAYLEPNEIEQLENAATNLRDKLLIRVLFHLGCRISEALGLKVEDIDFAQGTVTIQHLKVRINLSCSKCGARLGKRHTFCPGCGHGVKQAVAKESDHRRVRTLPIDNETLNILKEYIDKGGPVLREGVLEVPGICLKETGRLSQSPFFILITQSEQLLPKLNNPLNCAI